jgi:hypothetical protein
LNRLLEVPATGIQNRVPALSSTPPKRKKAGHAAAERFGFKGGSSPHSAKRTPME